MFEKIKGSSLGLPVTAALAFALALFPFFAARADDPPLHPTLQYQSSWIGNSVVTPDNWVQKDALGLAVAPDGTCYLPSTWDEAGKGLGMYRDGQPVGRCEHIQVGDGGVAADGKYVYSPTSVKIAGKRAKRLLRWNLDGTSAPLPGPGGTNYFDYDFTAWVPGLCSYGGEVFVVDAANNQIVVFDRETLAQKRTFAAPGAFRLAVDSGGLLWILGRSNDEDPRKPAATLAQYTLDGKPTGKAISDISGAMAIAPGPGGRLLVAGPDDQVIEYDVSGPRPVKAGTLGAAGGVFAGAIPGAMGPDRLFGLVGVGADTAGNIYTADRSYAMGGSFDLRKFDTKGNLVWQLVNQGFTDCAAVDPGSDGLDVYTRAEHYHLDYSKPAGQQWTWTGYTLDPRNDDGRLDIGGFSWSSPMLRRLNGRLYMFQHPDEYIGVFKQGPGDVFTPCAAIDLAPTWLITAGPDNAHYHELDWPAAQPSPRVRWDWTDKNGDGKAEPDEFTSYPSLLNEVGFISNSWVDDNGNIWLSGAAGGDRTLWELPMQGFDAHENPIYKLANLVRVPMPPEFTNVERLIYLSGPDTMYLSGETKVLPKIQHRESIGSEIIRYDHWSTPQRAITWRMPVPPGKKGDDSFFPSFALAGDKLFLMQRWWSRIWVYDANSASYLGSITTTPETGTSGWCDMDNGISAFQRKNGDYVLFAEDDYRPKIRMYVVPPQKWEPQPPPDAEK